MKIPKAKRRRFASEDAVLTEIDRKRDERARLNFRAEVAQRAADDCARRAMELDEATETLKGALHTEAMEQARRERDDFWKLKKEAWKARRRARTIEEGTLPNLGDLLSELRTLPLKPVGGG